MAAPKTVKRLGGGNPSAQDVVALQYDPPSVPMDQASMAQAIIQLQNTVNELIVRHNQLCIDAAHTGDEVTGTAQAASNLFTTT